MYTGVLDLTHATPIARQGQGETSEQALAHVTCSRPPLRAVRGCGSSASLAASVSASLRERQ